MVSSCSWQEVFSLYKQQTLSLKAATHFWRHNASVLALVIVVHYSYILKEKLQLRLLVSHPTAELVTPNNTATAQLAE